MAEDHVIRDIATLEALYGAPSQTALDKVTKALTPLYRQWIAASRLVILSTVGPDGTDSSPRGDDGPVVRIADDMTLLLPDWRGNNRIDSLRNIVADGRVSLMFLVPGSNTVVRINGRAVVTTAAGLVTSFEQNGKHPRSIIQITIAEVYFQCAKALMRSKTWTAGDQSAGLPTPGQLVREQVSSFDATDYDTHYAARAVDRMW